MGSLTTLLTKFSLKIPPHLKCVYMSSERGETVLGQPLNRVFHMFMAWRTFVSPGGLATLFRVPRRCDSTHNGRSRGKGDRHEW